MEGTRILGIHIPELKGLAGALRREGKAEAALEYFERQALTSAREDDAVEVAADDVAGERDEGCSSFFIIQSVFGFLVQI